MSPHGPSESQHASHEGWGTLRRFLPYLWPAGRPTLRRNIMIAVLLVLASKAVTLALPFAYKGAVDAMSGGGSAAAAGPGTGAGPMALQIAMAFTLAYVLGRFATVLFDNLRNIAFERVGQEATRQLAVATFNRLHQLSLRFHLARLTGEVTKTIDRGTKSIDVMIYFMLFNVAPTVIELVAVAVIFYFSFGWGLVLATAVAVLTYAGVTRWITEWRNALRERMNRLDGQALARSVDSLLNYETVKYFGAEARESARFQEAAQQFANAAVKSENSLGVLNIVQATITSLLMAGAMAWTVCGWSQGRHSVGDLVLVQTYLVQLFRPLDMLGMVYRTIRQGLTDMAQMFALLDTPVEVADRPGAPALVVRQPTLVFDNVVFGYESDRTILNGLSFAVEAGQQVAVVGPSGAGKSTIARLVFRFYDPWSGRILIDGQDISTVTQESLRRALGIVPQDSVLFNDTIGYNIGYGRAGADAATVKQAAIDAALMPLVERLPQGFETEVGERGLKLSGGEKQRVAIARTLVKNPPILLLDEATSALDTRTEQEILATLNRIASGRTSLSIAHRLSTIADADRILVLNEGAVAEQGTHGELLRQDGLYAQMWLRQAEAIEDHDLAKAE